MLVDANTTHRESIDRAVTAERLVSKPAELCSRIRAPGWIRTSTSTCNYLSDAYDSESWFES